MSAVSPRIRDLTEAQFHATYGCDRFAATVLGNRLEYVLEHICQRLLACAFSPLLRDFYDFAATITGPPQIGYPTPVVSKSFMAFTGTMTESVRNTIEEYGPENLQPGDVIIGNDPYRIGTHVNDVLFCRPIFHDGRLAAFVTLKAHQLDIGGSVPGGFSVTKTSSYENGLVLSPRALVKAGVPQRETWSLIIDNARFAPVLLRDMQTICDCLDLGEALIQASLTRYGYDALLGAMRYVCDADAERMTTALARIPDGQWKGEALVDCDGLDDKEEFPVRCTITKRGERIEIDLSGTARQARTSINGTFLDVKATVGVALKFMFDPNGRFTSGMYRSVDIVIPDGAICSALPPEGVVFAYGESTNALLLAMLQAMASAIGDDAVAGDVGSPFLHTARGVNADGSMWIAVGVAGGEAGAWGATRAGDADSYSKFYQANSIDTAIETSEADSPVVILRREYLTDTGGPGFNRGGASVLKDSTFMLPAAHNLITLRFKQPTGKGVLGGGDGGMGGVWLWHPQSGERYAAHDTGPASYLAAVRVAGRLDKDSAQPSVTGDYHWFGREPEWPTAAGAVWRYVTPGGGGWGDAHNRDPERVKRDVRDGYVSIDGARRDYSVAILGDPARDPEGLTIDAAVTQQLRAQRRG
ncbi:MAG TPA: hydantoinase B/oxoprolinase family protein [Steroidobacteraceae bacterium]|nr:hydantoinase B/oxoprolinase family protein [Steroidobacteraceae bacterium]